MAALGDLVEIITPKPFKAVANGELVTVVNVSDFPPGGFLGGIPGNENFSSCGQACQLRPYDILIHRVSLKVALVGNLRQILFAGKNVFILRVRDAFFLDGEIEITGHRLAVFIYMFLRSSRGQHDLAMSSSGVAIKAINKSSLNNLDIPLNEFNCIDDLAEVEILFDKEADMCDNFHDACNTFNDQLYNNDMESNGLFEESKKRKPVHKEPGSP